MARTLISRLLAGVLALAAGFAAPAAALAHGYAHHREAAAEHRHDGHHGDHGDAGSTAASDPSDAPAEHADVIAAVSEPPAEDAGGHAHPRLDSALSTRVEWPAFTVAVLRVALAVEYRALTRPAPVVEREDRRPGDLAHAPPPPSRAPPPHLG